MLEMFVIGGSLSEPYTSETALHNTYSPSVGRYKAKATKLLAVVHYCSDCMKGRYVALSQVFPVSFCSSVCIEKEYKSGKKQVRPGNTHNKNVVRCT